MSSVAREASASVQRASEEEIQDIADALLREEIQIHTVVAEGVTLPPDQRDEAFVDKRAGDIIAHIRPLPAAVSVWADLTQASGCLLEFGALSAPMPDGEPVDVTEPAGPLGGDASDPSESSPTFDDLLSGPSLPWNGLMAPYPYEVDDYAPRWFTGLAW